MCTCNTPNTPTPFENGVIVVATCYELSSNFVDGLERGGTGKNLLVGFIIAVQKMAATTTDYHCSTNKDELRTNVIELAEDGLGLNGNGIPTGTMGKLTRFELDTDGLATG
ncbi:hypothetical protein DPMN_176984 [Dreissena polymorpha]|uniref:Uncharacterized protein n=1 Tax=Dreissena polymorpha TaxID=45954 RepID=A0A9D4IJR8_DREPO|nr:hypothetical protein DPMN_176984 [Dreissena polymorpha]